MTRIGVAGFGFVGQAVYKCIVDKEHPVEIYDPPRGYDSLDRITTCDVIFCCLPSPMNSDGSQNFVAYTDFLGKVKASGFKGILVIKSTVLYSSVQPFLKQLDIVMNPEFLNQNTAYEDFQNQKVVVLGGRVDLCMKVAEIYQRYFTLKNPEFMYCTEKDAIEIKYIHNTYHAYKVLFWNYVGEVTRNHRKIFSAYSKITGNTHEMSNICSDGYPGYGGACFPKDVKAINSERPHVLTEFMINFNKKLRGNNE